MAASSRRIRDYGFSPGVLTPGTRNDLSDIAGVRVGQVTREDGEHRRTGVTAILPHGGNPYLERVPAGLAVGNGHGKLAGATQLKELGELETPIVLVNTLSVGRAVEALVDWTLAQPGCESVRSVNAVVGETNDSPLNAIRRRGLDAEDIHAALAAASGEPVAQGAVGAGTGTMAFGFKGGIGSSSRVLPAAAGGWQVGALVQANFGGTLQIEGLPLGKRLDHYWHPERTGYTRDEAAGSIMIVVATDAPVSDRNLTRLARRALAGLARTGANFQNGSGDYALAFATHPAVRRRQGAGLTEQRTEVTNEAMSGLFLAAIEAVEEAIYNALVAADPATATDELDGSTVSAGSLLDRAGPALSPDVDNGPNK
ncbi:P1 family peptidase [Pseudohaliea sp.]|uniref:P1 family peptidase n=1 Tax=Pseudohaliea sp. TaxID=2740289 RepID=UPI0032ED1F22